MITKIELQSRFLKDAPDRRMGAIASDLVRLANLEKSSQADPALSKNLFLELKLFTEWTAPAVPAPTQELLLGLRRSIVRWERDDVFSEARGWSQKILEAANG